MEKLRDEIIAAQNARIDLLKWKLIIVSALAAAGLGIGATKDTTNFPLVLCCIPIVCAYVDLLCQHLTLRMLVIGRFIRTQSAQSVTQDAGKNIISYEIFVDRAEVRPAFVLESYALIYSSALLSVAVIIYGFTRPGWKPYLLSGLIGLALTAIVNLVYFRQSHAIDAVN